MTGKEGRPDGYACLLWLDDSAAITIVRALEAHHSELRRNGVRPLSATVDLAATLGTKVLARHPQLDPATFFAAVAPEAPEGAVLLTVPQTASALGLSVRTVQRLIAGGRLPSVKVARSRRVRPGDVELFACAPDRQEPTPAATGDGLTSVA